MAPRTLGGTPGHWEGEDTMESTILHEGRRCCFFDELPRVLPDNLSHSPLDHRHHHPVMPLLLNLHRMRMSTKNILVQIPWAILLRGKLINSHLVFPPSPDTIDIICPTFAAKQLEPLWSSPHQIEMKLTGLGTDFHASNVETMFGSKATSSNKQFVEEPHYHGAKNSNIAPPCLLVVAAAGTPGHRDESTFHS
jgi:hypothetical protein